MNTRFKNCNRKVRYGSEKIARKELKYLKKKASDGLKMFMTAGPVTIGT